MNDQSDYKLILSFISRVLAPIYSFYSRLYEIASLTLYFRFCLLSHYEHIKIMSNGLPPPTYSTLLIILWII
jgi:hypothetical protein